MARSTKTEYFGMRNGERTEFYCFLLGKRLRGIWTKSLSVYPAFALIVAEKEKICDRKIYQKSKHFSQV